MTNNDILKKLRVALQMRDDQIVEVLELVNFRISKGEVGNFFRAEDHPKYVECQDQILRNFLNGLVIYLRGTKEDPKNPKDVLAKIASTKQPLHNEDFKKTEKTFNTPKPYAKKTGVSTGNKPQYKRAKSGESQKLSQKDVLGNVRFNNGKTKKKND